MWTKRSEVREYVLVLPGGERGASNGAREKGGRERERIISL